MHILFVHETSYIQMLRRFLTFTFDVVDIKMIISINIRRLPEIQFYFFIGNIHL